MSSAPPPTRFLQCAAGGRATPIFRWFPQATSAPPFARRLQATVVPPAASPAAPIPAAPIPSAPPFPRPLQATVVPAAPSPAAPITAAPCSLNLKLISIEQPIAYYLYHGLIDRLSFWASDCVLAAPDLSLWFPVRVTSCSHKLHREMSPFEVECTTMRDKIVGYVQLSELAAPSAAPAAPAAAVAPTCMLIFPSVFLRIVCVCIVCVCY